MTDSRFFTVAAPLSIAAITDLTGAVAQGVYKDDAIFGSVAPLDKAGPGDISFLDNRKYKTAFESTKAGAVFVRPDMVTLCPPKTIALVTRAPYKAYAQTAQALFPADIATGKIAASAHIHPDAKLGAGCTVEDGAVIQAGAEIGEQTFIGANAVIGRGVIIGARGRVGANASISHAIIGDGVNIYPGVRIGQDGFGFAIDPTGFVKVPQLGRVLIGHNVEIGANTTIDRGAGPDTEIGDGTWIDNLVQIGHNVKVGRGCVIVAQAGVSGSTVIEDYVMIGGQTGVAGHLRIGKGAKIAGHSGVMRDVPPGVQMMGYPATTMKSYLRQVAFLRRLIKKNDHDGE